MCWGEGRKEGKNRKEKTVKEIERVREKEIGLRRRTGGRENEES